MTNDYPGYKGAGSFSDEFELKIAHLQFDGLESERFIQRPYIEGDHDTITIKAPPRPPTSWGDLSYVPSGGYFPPTIPSEEPELEEQHNDEHVADGRSDYFWIPLLGVIALLTVDAGRSLGQFRSLSRLYALLRRSR